MPLAVIKSKRSESDMEFVYTARQLHIHTIRKCTNFPKRYTFYVGQPLAACATRIHEGVKIANSIHPINQHEAQMRRDNLLQANAELFNMVSQIEIAHELFGIDAEKMVFWMDLVNKEIRLVKGTLKKDRERYKDLP